MKLRLRLVALSVVLVSTTTTIFGQADSELRNKADQLFHKEQYADATQLYLQLLSLQPKDIDLNYRYGVCLLYNSSNKSEAIRYLTYVVREKSEMRDAYFFLGKAYHLGYNFDQATTNYTIYLSKAGNKGAYVAEAKRNLEMSANGKKLLTKSTEIHVLERQEVPLENFHRGYNLDNIGGSLIQAVDFQSKEDKKKGHKPVVHLLSGTDLIYYSSYGDGDNLDLYVVRRLPNGNYGSPQKLAGEVNTPYDENYPYMHPNGKELFFSSKGHNSMGGYDIFKATFDPINNQFISVENIDFAVSSADDDLLYLVDESYKYAYFASNRQSANGKINLYKVAVDRFPSNLVILKGTFNSEINPEFKNLVIEVYDYQTNRKIGRFQTNDVGDYVVVLPKGGKYTFKSSSTQFKGGFSQLVEVPYLEEVKPLRQYAKHYAKGVNPDVQFINAFSETVDNASDVIAEAFRIKGDLQPNERPSSISTEVSSEANSTFGKTAQRLGLPDWGVTTLFNHIDGLIAKYNVETEKNLNLKEIQNALVFQEYQKIEKLDEKLIDLAAKMQVASSNREIREIESAIAEFKAQRQESERWLQKLEENREAILALYHKVISKEQYSVEHMNGILEKLFQAQKVSDEAFGIALESVEKEIKVILKEPASVYKSLLAEKNDADKKIEQLENLIKTNNSRLREVKQQLSQNLLELEQAKAKSKASIESKVDKNEQEIDELEANNSLVSSQLIGLKNKQDSLITLVQLVNRTEQFKGTPVSAKMVAQASQKYQNSPISKDQMIYENTRIVESSKGDELSTNTPKAIPGKSDVDKRSTVEKSSSINSVDDNRSSFEENKIVATTNPALEGSVDLKTASSESIEIVKTGKNATEAIGGNDAEQSNTLANVSSSSINTSKTADDLVPLEKRSTVAQGMNSDVVGKVVTTDDVINVATTTSSSKENIPTQVSEKSNLGRESFRFVNQLSVAEKEILKAVDPSYVNRVEKLESRTLNAGEQRVLIDLHRKFLEKVEAQQSAIQFGDRQPKTEDELEVLSNINQQLTKSVRILNNLLSFDEIEEVNVKSVKEEALVVKSEISVVNQEVVALKETRSSETVPLLDERDRKSLNTVSDTNLFLTREPSTALVEKKDTQLSSLEAVNEDVPTPPMVQRTNKVFNDEIESTPWVKVQSTIDQIKNQILEQEQFLERATTKKQKSEIKEMLILMKSELAAEEIKRDQIIFDALALDKLEVNDFTALQRLRMNAIENKTDQLAKAKKVQEKAELSKTRLAVAEDLLALTETQQMLKLLEQTQGADVNLLNLSQLNSQIQYLDFRASKLKEEQDALSSSTTKDKKVKIQNGEIIDALAEEIVRYETASAFLIERIKDEEKFHVKATKSEVAPSFADEYTILSSPEYEQYALAKSKLIDKEYVLKIANIALDNKRDEVQGEYANHGVQSEGYKKGLIEIGELESNRGEAYKAFVEQEKEVNKFTPSSSPQKEYFDNLVARGMNPIVHKQLGSPLVELDPKGITYNSELTERRELNLDSPKGLVYRVQVGAFKNDIPPHLFKEFTPVTAEWLPNSSIKRYLAGYFSNVLMAQSAKDEILELGYHDAFVIAYCDGNRITLAEAKELEEKGLCKSPYMEQITFEINRSNVARAQIIDRTQLDLSNVNPLDYNKAEGAALAEAMEGMTGLYFTVQVGVYNRPASPDRFYGQNPLYTLRLPNGQIRYSVGAYTDLSEARAREKSLKAAGLRDAYVVAYHKGERIAIYQAMDLMDKGIIPSISGKSSPSKSEPVMIIKEEKKIFTDQKRATWNEELSMVQLISKDSFASVPVDFLNRFRVSSYFYYDAQEGRVKSQLVESSHYLVQMEQLKPHFIVQSQPKDWKLNPMLNAVSINVPNSDLRADLADLVIRHTNRVAIKELDRGMQITIFVKTGEETSQLEKVLKEMNLPYSINEEVK